MIFYASAVLFDGGFISYFHISSGNENDYF